MSRGWLPLCNERWIHPISFNAATVPNVNDVYAYTTDSEQQHGRMSETEGKQGRPDRSRSRRTTDTLAAHPPHLPCTTTISNEQSKGKQTDCDDFAIQFVNLMVRTVIVLTLTTRHDKRSEPIECSDERKEQGVPLMANRRESVCSHRDSVPIPYRCESPFGISCTPNSIPRRTRRASR